MWRTSRSAGRRDSRPQHFPGVGMAPAKARQTQTERREEAERRIIEATIKLISRKGFSNWTLADVGDEAGYSRGLPAHYFGPKDDLVMAVAGHILEEYRLYAEHRAPPGMGLPTIQAGLRSYVRATRRNAPMARATVLIYSESLVNPKLAAKLEPLISERIDAIAAEIRAGVALANIRADVDAEIESAKIFAFVRGALNLSALDAQFPLEKVFESFASALDVTLRP